MAQIIEIDAVDGFTQTVMQLTDIGSDTVVGTATIAAAATNRKTAYGGSFSGLTQQYYEVRLFMSVADGGHALSKGVAKVDAADGVFPTYDQPVSGEGGSGSTTISDEDIQEIVAGVTAVAPRICDSSAGTFRMTAGDTWIQDFTVTTTGADKFIIAVKNNAADDDTAAVLLIDSVDGLERINGSAPDDASDASIATGAATITATVESNITLMIVPGKYAVTVKKLDVGSDVTPISTASLTVFAPGVSEIST
jgi:hypothetical protein